MANKGNIFRLTKYQMAVLYYKCKEGATHEEIAERVGRDVKTVQYHMTKIYKILEISGPGKSKEEMDSELKNDICPTIRQMFPTFDSVKTWAPRNRDAPDDEDELGLPGEVDAPGEDKKQLAPPVVLKGPPARRIKMNWRLTVIGLIVVSITAIAIFAISHLANIYLPRPPVTQSSVAKDGMTLLPVAAGEFKMGSNKADDPKAYDDETPQHIVFLDDFLIDKTEVTNAQYAMCVQDGACTIPDKISSSTRASYYDDPQFANYPVIFVSWSEANDYCTWAGRQLPTEAMWEKAARGPDGLIYPWGNTFDGTKANHCDKNCPSPWKTDFNDGFRDTSPVGNYAEGASFYSALDMAGNVYEWVADGFAPYTQDRQTNPIGPLSGSEHIIRGGSWGDDPEHNRAAVRSHVNVPASSDFIGFRCATVQK